MKLYIYFMFLSLFLTMFSCKNESQPGKSIENLVSGKSDVRQIDFISYNDDTQAEKWFEYNEQGDIIREAVDIDTMVYQYEGRKIVKRHIDKSLSWHSATEYLTDLNGRIISADIFDEKDKKVSTIKYSYNTEGYLMKSEQLIIQSNSNLVNEFEYKDGNIDQVKIFDTEGKLTATYIYDYYPDKVNILNLFIENIADDILPNERMGIRNKNLVKQLSNKTTEGDTLSLVKYNYGELLNGTLTCVQIDDINEFETKIIYHLK
ncbi:MAG: hypothetical protein IPL55_13345 [Saprospiraceae bacterium]|nr:hypothetical protein [Saprospiraceae bacterium]